MTDKRLHILNASAGSGKTYRLVQEYIELLIDDKADSKKFASIIAMTFTNKAALEMKERIIKGLDEISYPDLLDTRELQLRTDLASTLKVSEDEIIDRCKAVLQNILHQYEEFHVMTIDKFNLRLIKSFSRDLDLPVDFEVVMEESEIIEKIVDQILDQLGNSDEKRLNKLILKYAESNIEEGASWNFRRQLVEFGKVLNSEKNIPIIKHLLAIDLSLEEYDSLFITKRAIDKKFNEHIKEAELLMNDPSLDFTSIHGGGNTRNDILSILKNERFVIDTELIKKRLNENLEKTDTDKKFFPKELKQSLYKLQNFWEQNLKEYVLLDQYLKNFFNIALLQYMARALEDVKKGEQIIRISEFNTLISKLIQEEEAPFIYERLGNKFEHFLLDEFQDTSHLQWLNLIPLIDESLGNNHKNLIVGDPKQSIYRFKNGVAEQFIALPGIYNPEQNKNLAFKSKLFEDRGYVDELVDNWRSTDLIVNFNNTFFDLLKQSATDKAKEFYTSIHQHVKKDLPGKVSIQSQEQKVSTEDLVPLIKERIDECLDAGFKHSDICILGARNIECNKWALALNELKYKVVSSDSLLINSDPTVQLTIAYFKWRYRPAGQNEAKQFAELYFRMDGKSYEQYHDYIVEEIKDDKTIRYFDDNKFLGDHFNDRSSFFTNYENLYHLVQNFFDIIGVDELNNPYLHHLADVVYNYSQANGPDLKSFLDDYETRKNKIAVQIPESDDAIKIMTIHKSKGLEFPVVIIPSIDLKIDVKHEFFVEIEDKIIYKSPNQNEILNPLRELYESEKEQVLIDSLNLCYVALTRPVERLYVTNYYQGSNFGKRFHDALNQLKDIKRSENELELIIEKGTHHSAKDQQLIGSYIPEIISDQLWFPDIALQDKKELDAADYLNEERQFGNQFHMIASQVDKAEDLPATIKSLLDEGEIERKYQQRLVKQINELFEDQQYRVLLQEHTHILNEQPILIDKNEVIRPDKVICKKEETIVVDFKTGEPNTKDHKQVQLYKSVLEDMNYPKVTGYLYYTRTGKLTPVS